MLRSGNHSHKQFSTHYWFHCIMWKQECKVTSTYYNVKIVRRFGGIQPLSKTSKMKTHKKPVCKAKMLYTLHKPVRYKFRWRKTIVSGPNRQLQGILIDVSRLSRQKQRNQVSSDMYQNIFSRRIGSTTHRLGHHPWSISIPPTTFYQNIFGLTREQNILVVGFNSGWKIAKLFIMENKDTKVNIVNISIKLRNPSCGIFYSSWLMDLHRSIAVSSGCLHLHSSLQYVHGT